MRAGRFRPAPCLGPQDVESLGEVKTVQKGPEKIFLPVLLVPVVRNCWHGEQAEWAPYVPSFCQHTFLEPPTLAQRKAGGGHQRQVGSGCLPFPAQRTWLALQMRSLGLNCIWLIWPPSRKTEREILLSISCLSLAAWAQRSPCCYGMPSSVLTIP